MLAGHNPYLVALSVVIAILGGYIGFGLAARIRSEPGAGRRLLLASAAGFLAVGIWTMHFIGMLAAPIPQSAVYLVLPTVVSFLICALVVGISLFFVSIGDASSSRVAASALLLGAGIVSMHYVGIYALSGDFSIRNDPSMVILATLIAVGSGYGGLRVFLARQGGARLALSAIVFGIAVSGMHYTAMMGMHFAPPIASAAAPDGLVASPQVLALIVALLCFILAAGFLLSLVPEPRRPARSVAGGEDWDGSPGWTGLDSTERDDGRARGRRLMSAPLGGLGRHPPEPSARVPVQGADGVHFIDVAEIRGVKADAHYTLIHDGTRERLCQWSISEAEEHLDAAHFVRVHRSHIIAIPHVALMRKEGDGAVVELDGPAPHLVPVSRAKIPELRARLGLTAGKSSPVEGEIGRKA